jgi:hypothetical protein
MGGIFFLMGKAECPVKIFIGRDIIPVIVMNVPKKIIDKVSKGWIGRWDRLNKFVCFS